MCVPFDGVWVSPPVHSRRSKEQQRKEMRLAIRRSSFIFFDRRINLLFNAAICRPILDSHIFNFICSQVRRININTSFAVTQKPMLPICIGRSATVAKSCAHSIYSNLTSGNSIITKIIMIIAVYVFSPSLRTIFSFSRSGREFMMCFSIYSLRRPFGRAVIIGVLSRCETRTNHKYNDNLFLRLCNT